MLLGVIADLRVWIAMFLAHLVRCAPGELAPRQVEHLPRHRWLGLARRAEQTRTAIAVGRRAACPPPGPARPDRPPSTARSCRAAPAVATSATGRRSTSFRTDSPQAQRSPERWRAAASSACCRRGRSSRRGSGERCAASPERLARRSGCAASSLSLLSTSLKLPRAGKGVPSARGLIRTIRTAPRVEMSGGLDIEIHESREHPYAVFFESLRRVRGERYASWKPGMGAEKRRAVLTIVQNEAVFLPIWLRYYSRFFAPDDIYVLDHESTDGSTSEVGSSAFRSHMRRLTTRGWFARSRRTSTSCSSATTWSSTTDVDEIVAPTRSGARSASTSIASTRSGSTAWGTRSST